MFLTSECGLFKKLFDEVLTFGNPLSSVEVEFVFKEPPINWGLTNFAEYVGSVGVLALAGVSWTAWFPWEAPFPL